MHTSKHEGRKQLKQSSATLRFYHSLAEGYLSLDNESINEKDKSDKDKKGKKPLKSTKTKEIKKKRRSAPKEKIKHDTPTTPMAKLFKAFKKPNSPPSHHDSHKIKSSPRDSNKQNMPRNLSASSAFYHHMKDNAPSLFEDYPPEQPSKLEVHNNNVKSDHNNISTELSPKPKTQSTGPREHMQNSGEAESGEYDSIDKEFDVIDESVLKIGKEIGKGTFGSVYVGHFSQQKVALKQLHFSNLSISSQDFVAKQLPKLKKLQKHPNILDIIAVGRLPHKSEKQSKHKGEDFVIIMEYMPFHSLDTMLSVICINPSLIIRITKDVAKAMEYLHSQGIKHKNLSSRNILMTRTANGAPLFKLCDFGFASISQIELRNAASSWGKVVFPDELEENQEQPDFNIHSKLKLSFTPKFGPLYTLKWAAPEVLGRGGQPGRFTYASDIWSFGITTIEFLVGKDPYIDLSIRNVIDGVRNKGLHPRKPNNCSKLLWELLESCWELDELQRPSFTVINEKLNEIDTTLPVVFDSESDSDAFDIVQPRMEAVLPLEDELDVQTDDSSESEDEWNTPKNAISLRTVSLHVIPLESDSSGSDSGGDSGSDSGSETDSQSDSESESASDDSASESA